MSATLLRGFSPTENSSTSWGQDREWKLFLKIFTRSTKRRQEVPSSLKLSNSSPSSSSTCLQEEWQPGSGTYYPWKHRLLTTQLTVGSVKLVQMKFCVFKKNPHPNHQTPKSHQTGLHFTAQCCAPVVSASLSAKIKYFSPHKSNAVTLLPALELTCITPSQGTSVWHLLEPCDPSLNVKC